MFAWKPEMFKLRKSKRIAIGKVLCENIDPENSAYYDENIKICNKHIHKQLTNLIKKWNIIFRKYNFYHYLVVRKDKEQVI